ncbi:hypothetical protein [Kineococcus sp. SYSU DK004]|uniref:hypothetical protein n=1 Tax=Kineococcus sp. SYSU DK004 TaxID=3383125 RepID=UPI003D7D737B
MDVLSFSVATASSFIAGFFATALGVAASLAYDRRSKRKDVDRYDKTSIQNLISFIANRRAFEVEPLRVRMPVQKDDQDLARCNTSVLNVRNMLHEVRGGLSMQQAAAHSILLAMERDCATYLNFTEYPVGRSLYEDALYELGERLYENERKLAGHFGILEVPKPGSVDRDTSWVDKIVEESQDFDELKGWSDNK